MVSGSSPNPTQVIAFTKQVGTNFHILFCRYFTASGTAFIQSVTTNGTGTFDFAGKVLGSDNDMLEIWFSSNLPASAMNITVTLNTSVSFFYANIEEYSSFPLGTISVNTPVSFAGTASAIAIPSFTTPAGNVLTIACGSQPGTDTVSSYAGQLAGATTRTAGNQVNWYGDLIPGANLNGTATITLLASFARGALVLGFAITATAPPDSVPSYVTTTNTGLQAGSSSTLSLSITLTQGRLYVLGFRSGQATAIQTLRDALGNQWNKIISQDGAGGNRIELWYVISNYSGATTVTATLSAASTNRAMGASEYKTNAKSVQINSAKGNAPNANPVVFPATNVPNVPSLIFGIADPNATSGTWSAPTGLLQNVRDSGAGNGNTLGMFDGSITTPSPTDTSSGATYSGGGSNNSSIIAVITPNPVTTEKISFGKKVTMTQDIIYALPGNLVNCTIITSAGTISVSDDGVSWQTATLSSNKNLRTAARFICSLSGDSDIVAYPIPRKKQ